MRRMEPEYPLSSPRRSRGLTFFFYVLVIGLGLALGVVLGFIAALLTGWIPIEC